MYRVPASQQRTPGLMIAICPPEYFPRLAYMALVQRVDTFILADTAPYRSDAFHDRARLRESQGWHCIEIPLFGQAEGAPLDEIEIENKGRWLEKHWRSFLYDYRTTMYFEFLEATFRPFFETTWERLGPCSCRSVELTCELFGIQTTVARASALPGAPDTIEDVAEAVDDTPLVLPSEMADSLDGVERSVASFVYEHPTYRQNFEGFEPGMTAADLVFNYGPEARRILAQGAAVRAAEQ